MPHAGCLISITRWCKRQGSYPFASDPLTPPQTPRSYPAASGMVDGSSQFSPSGHARFLNNGSTGSTLPLHPGFPAPHPGEDHVHDPASVPFGPWKSRPRWLDWAPCFSFEVCFRNGAGFVQGRLFRLHMCVRQLLAWCLLAACRLCGSSFIRVTGSSAGIHLVV